MRIVVTSSAYLGDVAPFVPVAERLAERGHAVTLLAPEGYRPLLEGHGERYTFRPSPLDFSAPAMHADPRHERLMRHPYRNAAQLGRYWMGLGWSNDPDRAEAGFRDAFAGADVVVTHPTQGSVTIPIAHALGIPVAVGHLFPMMIPTTSWGPPAGKRFVRLGATGNRLAWRSLWTLSAPFFDDRSINRLRRRLGQPTIRNNAAQAFREAEADVLLVSRRYFGDSPPDWPPHTWGGFSVWSPAGGVPPEVDEVVGDGSDPPVLVTLGTSAASGAGAQFATIAADLDRRGLRSLLLVGDARNLEALPGRKGAFAFAPVVPLLPRCRVAVISGALGGIAAALSAGIPIVVLPQLFDQIWHGQRVQDLGVGRLVRRASDVGSAVADLAGDAAVHERCRALAEKLAGEDGAAVLATAAESLGSAAP